MLPDESFGVRVEVLERATNLLIAFALVPNG